MSGTVTGRVNSYDPRLDVVPNVGSSRRRELHGGNTGFPLEANEIRTGGGGQKVGGGISVSDQAFFEKPSFFLIVLLPPHPPPRRSVAVLQSWYMGSLHLSDW